jgi:hypothetical protein
VHAWWMYTRHTRLGEEDFDFMWGVWVTREVRVLVG